MEKLLSFLFRNSVMKPQIGFAGTDKVGKLWLPGVRQMPGERVVELMGLPFRGCTQLAFESWWKPVGGQQGEVCWFGLDIDKHDNEHVDLIEWAGKFVRQQPVSMVRTSCGGRGLHMIWVLDRPIACDNHSAGPLVKRLCAPYKHTVEEHGIEVCQANRRMFWLVGGRNETIHESDYVVELGDTIPELRSGNPNSAPTLNITPSIQRYVDLLQERKVLGQVGVKNPVYVGDAVTALRSIGERVETRSSMRGNGQTNGYVDIEGHRISLWSYADGHVIWNFDDIGAMFNED